MTNTMTKTMVDPQSRVKKRTLLLCFIHGFKGGNDTFGKFPDDLRRRLMIRLQLQQQREQQKQNGRHGRRGRYFDDHDIRTIIYPQFETRGDLMECVGRFREWLKMQALGIEAESGSHSPNIDPTVDVILIGHSMGGIVATETVLAITHNGESRLAPAAKKRKVDDGDRREGDITLSSQSLTSKDLKSQTTTYQTLKSQYSPRIIGILTFDTPFLGLAPSVIAHGAEAKYKTATSAYKALNSLSNLSSAVGLSDLSSVAGLFGYGSSRNKFGSESRSEAVFKSGHRSGPRSTVEYTKSDAKSDLPQDPSEALDPATKTPAHSASNKNSNDNEHSADSNNSTSSWQSWSKMAIYAGAAGALAAGGATAAYFQRDSIMEGWSWISSHLEFVGCLAKGEQLRRRLDLLINLRESHQVEFINLVTILGRSAGPSTSDNSKDTGNDKTDKDNIDKDKPSGISNPISTTDGKARRTFCNLPKSETTKAYFELTRNNLAHDEIEAHKTMFEAETNDNYEILLDRANEILSTWVLNAEDGTLS